MSWVCCACRHQPGCAQPGNSSPEHSGGRGRVPGQVTGKIREESLRGCPPARNGGEFVDFTRRSAFRRRRFSRIPAAESRGSPTGRMRRRWNPRLAACTDTVHHAERTVGLQARQVLGDSDARERRQLARCFRWNCSPRACGRCSMPELVRSHNARISFVESQRKLELRRQPEYQAAAKSCSWNLLTATPRGFAVDKRQNSSGGEAANLQLFVTSWP